MLTRDTPLENPKMIEMGWRYKMDHLEGGFDLFQELGRRQDLLSADILCQSVAESCPQSRQHVLWGMVLVRTRNSGMNQNEGKSVHRGDRELERRLEL